MDKLNWVTLYKNQGTHFHKVRKLAQEKTFEDDGDYLCQLRGGQSLVRLTTQGEVEYVLPMGQKPDELLIDRDNDRLITRSSTTVSCYDLESGKRLATTWLEGRHRRSMAADRDGEIHVEEGRRVFTYDDRMKLKHSFEVPFAPCEVLHHNGSQCWVFEDSEPRGILITDESGRHRYRSDGELECLDTSLDQFTLLETAPQGHRRLVREQAGEFVAHDLPPETLLVYPAGSQALVVCAGETGIELKVVSEEGRLQDAATVEGAPYDFFATNENLYLLTSEGDRRTPSQQRLVRFSRVDGSVEVLHQQIHQGPMFAAENAAGRLIVQTSSSVLELDHDGRLLQNHDHPAGLKSKTLVSKPVSGRKYFHPDLRTGWQAFLEKGVKAFDYPTPYDSRDLPFLTPEGNLNFSSGVSFEEKRAEFASLGIDGEPQCVTQGQTRIPSSNPPGSEGVPEHYRIEGEGHLYSFRGKEPRLLLATREGEEISTFMPLEKGYSRMHAAGMENGNVAYGWAQSSPRFEMDSPVRRIEAHQGYLVAQSEDGSSMVLRTSSELSAPQTLESEELEVFDKIYGQFRARREMRHYSMASKVFQWMRELPEPDREPLGMKIAACMDRVPEREIERFLGTIREDSRAADAEALNAWLDHKGKPEWSWTEQFQLYRDASPAGRLFVGEQLDRERDIEEVLPVVELMDGNAPADPDERFAALEKWLNIDLKLPRDQAAPCLKALTQLRLESESDWSVEAAFRVLNKRGGGLEEIARFADRIRAGGAAGLEVAMATEPGEELQIDLEFEENSVMVGSQMLPISEA